MLPDDEADGLHSPPRPWCFFRCGAAPFALGLESVCEVVEAERLVRLPMSPPGILGLCNFRREAVPVVALREDAGDEERDGGRPLVLILRTVQGHWAFRIAPGGTVVGQGKLEGPRPSSPAVGRPVCLGTVRHGETSYAAIDPEATWASVRERVEAWYAEEWCRGASHRIGTVPPPADPAAIQAKDKP